MTQRIWVPRFLYAVIPWLYLCGGGSCLVAAVHLPDHQWVVPYALFLGMAGLHSGLLVLSFRRRVNRDAARNG